LRVQKGAKGNAKEKSTLKSQRLQGPRTKSNGSEEDQMVDPGGANWPTFEKKNTSQKRRGRGLGKGGEELGKHWKLAWDAGLLQTRKTIARISLPSKISQGGKDQHKRKGEAKAEVCDLRGKSSLRVIQGRKGILVEKKI